MGKWGRVFLVRNGTYWWVFWYAPVAHCMPKGIDERSAFSVDSREIIGASQTSRWPCSFGLRHMQLSNTAKVLQLLTEKNTLPCLLEIKPKGRLEI